MHLTQFFLFAKTNLLLIWNTSAKKKNDSDKSSIFCARTKSRKQLHFVARPRSRSCFDVYPGRSNIFRPLNSLRMMQNIFEKCAERPSRGAIGCCSNIFVELSNKRTNSARTIEELLVKFVPQTFTRYFQNSLLKSNQQFVETTYIF